MSNLVDRRRFFEIAAASGWMTRLTGKAEAAAINRLPIRDGDRGQPIKPFLTAANDFVDVSRGNPKPFTLKGEALAKARLTPETWRLEIVSDGSAEIARPIRLRTVPPSTWLG